MEKKKWVVVGIDDETRRQLERLQKRMSLDSGKQLTMTEALRTVLKFGIAGAQIALKPLPYGCIGMTHTDGSFTPVSAL